MGKLYKITGGHRFVVPTKDGGQRTLGEGETLELDDDVAAMHAGKVELVQAPAPDESGPAAEPSNQQQAAD